MFELTSLVRGILDTGARRPRLPRLTPRLRGQTPLVELKQLSPPLQLGKAHPARTQDAHMQSGKWGARSPRHVFCTHLCD